MTNVYYLSVRETQAHKLTATIPEMFRLIKNKLPVEFHAGVKVSKFLVQSRIMVASMPACSSKHEASNEEQGRNTANCLEKGFKAILKWEYACTSCGI